MPGTVDPITGVQGFWARLQELRDRITSLEAWQRAGYRAGAATITGNGAGGQTLAIAHGLGRVPRWALAQAALVPGASAYVNETVSQYQAPDATNLYVQGAGVKTAGQTYGYFWAAG